MGYRAPLRERGADCPPTCRGRRGPANRRLDRAADGGSGVEAQWVTIRRVPIYAHEQARRRRWTGARVERDDELPRLPRTSQLGVVTRQIAATWPKRQGGVISSRVSTKFLRPGRPAQEPRLEALPATGEVEGGRRRRKGSSSASFIAHRRPGNAPRRRLTARPSMGTGRPMLFGGPGRRRPCTSASRASCSWRGCLRKRRGRSPRPSPGCWGHCPRRSMGPSSPATRGRPRWTFFCDTYSPWQKGGVENAIGRLRRFLPRKMNLAEGAGGAVYGSRWRTTIRRVSASATGRDIQDQSVALQMDSPSRFRGNDGCGRVAQRSPLGEGKTPPPRPARLRRGLPDGVHRPQPLLLRGEEQRGGGAGEHRRFRGRRPEREAAGELQRVVGPQRVTL